MNNSFNSQEYNTKTLKPEAIVPRVGYYLVETGEITEGDLSEALKFQISLPENVPTPLLGEILVNMGKITQETLDRAVTEQIISLRNALQTANEDLEQRVAERTIALQKALDQLSELDSLKSNFVSNISHELRTPLTHIKGYLDLLSSQMLGKLNEDQNEAITVMDRASNRLGKLIEDLILFSVIECDNLELFMEDFSVKEVCDYAINQVRQNASAKHIILKTQYDDQLPLVKGDKEKIGWVVQQFLDNAIKFTPRQGDIIVVATSDSSNKVSISVKDMGIGIPEGKLDEIFEPFHQLDGNSARKFGGTGLGLSLAKEIIQAHDSKIIVRSNTEQGSEFSFFLQVNKEDST